MARVLDRLGYRTSVKLLPPSRYVLRVGDRSTKAQIGITGLDAHSGSPSEFIVDPFSCPGPGVDSVLNLSRFCDRSIDDAIDRALSLQETDQYAANRAWEALDHRLVDLAPLIPFATPGAPIVVSERVGNYQQNPLLGVLLDQLWVR
ncbi:MAG: hypothetical protein ABI595_08575 [Actinomycetota bacterium]